MKRPNNSRYVDWDDFSLGMEKYCDQLEKQNKETLHWMHMAEKETQDLKDYLNGEIKGIDSPHDLSHDFVECLRYYLLIK